MSKNLFDLSQDLWALKIVPLGSFNDTIDMQKESQKSLYLKKPIRIESKGAISDISFSSKSWIKSLDLEKVENEEELLESIKDDVHSYLIKNPISYDALIYHAEKSELILWRGSIKRPLYWSINKNTLILSNNLREPIRHGWLSPTLNMSTIESYLYFGEIPQDSSMLEGFEKLAPGEGLVYSLSTSLLFDFHSSKLTLNPIKNRAFSSPLEALWELEEPHIRLFLPKKARVSSFNDLGEQLRSFKPLKPFSYPINSLINGLLAYLTSSNRIIRKIRASLLMLFYRPIHPIIKWMQARSLFTYQEIDANILLNSHQGFKPWNFLQQLTNKRLHEVLISWPNEIEEAFYKLLPYQQGLFEQDLGYFDETINWSEIMAHFYKSSLIEESLISATFLPELEELLKKEDLRAYRQISVLLALELWLKIFIDFHTKLPEGLKNWDELIYQK